jgi:peptidoglycan-associated lipoprotein
MEEAMRENAGIWGLVFMLTCGCSHDVAPVKSPPTAAAAPIQKAAMPSFKSPSQSLVAIAADIRHACGIGDADAYFTFDSARLERGDYPALQKLAACFSTGALSGKGMRLVGHSDPRGDAEYNLVLGGRRADGVRDFLVGHGLPSQRVATTSRGELDAQGTDEASWAQDRRVDVKLAN